eukprot:gnl/TRDRNA2_/TRDRNA2_168929_c0_seq1.p1 gnl/TRDRNA2_/TRDRNA2_168929_c0~~gnl/TRDRNA2_/TRDRNA2_168929_c0_seq1.p1  ORF type:complete len:376 (+),score=65.07 gnl/TRDRNA2_/TRDRNA2_168929_c0_seq1:32-1129(+)
MLATAHNAMVLRLLKANLPQQARGLLCDAAADGIFDGVSRQLWQRCGGEEVPPAVHPAIMPAAGDPHEKELRLLAYVLAAACPGDPHSICRAIEAFGVEQLAPAGQWLKVAGGQKAEVLAQAVHKAPRRADGIRVLEVGTYCGYSALVLATAADGCTVVTLEAEPARVVIARSIIEFAGLSHAITVCTGHSQDVLPWLAEKRKQEGQSAVFDMVFLDQRGARYRYDLETLEQNNLLRPGAMIVADNVLKPGAPAYLWHVLYGGDYETHLTSMEEFAMSGTEDWMAVSKYVPRSQDTPAPPAPSAVHRLEWRANRMRARAQAKDPHGGVGFSEWAAFAECMRRDLAAIGIKLTPSEHCAGSEAESD